jgi:signal transduction histidine kinase
MQDAALSPALRRLWWIELLRSLWESDRDPRLDDMRWRLNLRLQLVIAGGSFAFFLVHLAKGRIDEVGLLVFAGLAAWAYLRGHAQHSRIVARIMLVCLLAESLFATFVLQPSAVHWALPTFMVLSVFGTLVDGMQGGGVVTLIALATAGICLATGIDAGMPLVVAFSALAALCLYLTCLAYTWMFNRLAARQHESGQAVANTSRVAEQLATTLSHDVVGAIARLRGALAKGLVGLPQAQELHQVLAQARGVLPADMPRAAMEPQELLNGLQRSVHRLFLGIGVVISILSTLLVLWFGINLWQLALLLAASTSALLWAGNPHSPRWQWRLQAFTALCLLSFATDIYLSVHPPAATLVFLPLLVFFVGMLAPPAAAWTTSLLGFGLLAWSHQRLPDMPGLQNLHMVLAILTLAMLVMTQMRSKIYRDLLADMAVEEDRLRQSLGAYRRMVSTLFHDLANPLAVLQTMASLPTALLTQDDEARAKRMLLRLEELASHSRSLAGDSSPSETSMALLADQLLDLFREKLTSKNLSFELSDGADVLLKRGSGLLRDLLLGHLLSNAIKYSPVGGHILLSARVHDAWITVSMRDQGSGFPADVLRDIGDGKSPFVRPGTQGELGNGFGLLEVSSSARELGGHLTLRNCETGGAEAELWLPKGPLEL